MLFKVVIEYDLARNLGHHSDVRGVHKDDMEHRNGETAWDFIFRRLKATLFLHIVDVLERVLLENE